jgi:hypothetical protein
MTLADSIIFDADEADDAIYAADPLSGTQSDAARGVAIGLGLSAILWVALASLWMAL